MDMTPLAERAEVAYATVGRGKRVHYSPRNDETLCGRFIGGYLNLMQASELLDDQGYEMCTPCTLAARQRAEARRLAAESQLATAAVALAETVEQVDAERTSAEQDVEPRYEVEEFGPETAGVWDTYTVDWAVKEATRDEAKETAARLNRENAEARAAGPIVFRFYSTREAYNASQTNDHIRDGDVLAIEREQVVGFLVSAWPCAITTAHGELHGFTTDPRTIDDGKYAVSVDLAEQVSRKLGAPLAGEQQVIEGVVVEHNGTAEGSTPSNAAHPDVAAARVALAGLAVATMTDHHDTTEPTDAERTVRGYLVDPRGQGRVAVYWLEEGRIVRHDEQGYGPSLDCLAWTLERAGWTVEKMLRSSQCVFAHRPAEAIPPAVEQSAPAAPECVHHIEARADVSGDPIKMCARKQPNQEAGVFNDEGCIEAYDCAVQAANRAAEWNAEADDPLHGWDLMCPEHREQQFDTCEECNASEDEAGEQDLVDEAEGAGTWRSRWIGAEQAPAGDALFDLGEDVEQGALFE